tara:strand:- start:5492 stop:5629 length:138 start_codon:yes stop_codon:yes gene_type:complete
MNYTEEDLAAITPEQFEAKTKAEQDNIKAANVAFEMKKRLQLGSK